MRSEDYQSSKLTFICMKNKELRTLKYMMAISFAMYIG